MCKQLPRKAQSSLCRRVAGKQDGGWRRLLNHYDWIYATDYKGTLFGESLKLKVVPTTDHIHTEKLKAREQIKCFEKVLLFEDELHDCGVSSLSVKITVMSSRFFLLLKFVVGFCCCCCCCCCFENWWNSYQNEWYKTLPWGWQDLHVMRIHITREQNG